MSTSPVSGTSIYQEVQSFYQNRRSDLQQLSKALNSGDLAAAQQAYDALDQLGKDGPFRNAESFSRSGRISDFAAIGQALQAGDLATAQTAFATLQATFGGHQSNSPASSPELPATLVSLGTMPPTFQPPATMPPAGQPRVTMPPTFQPPATMPPAGPPHVTMPPTFQPPATMPPSGPPHVTMPPTFQPPPTMPPTFEPPAGSIYQQMQNFRAGRRSDLNELGKALQAGDMSAAQQEYDALVALGNGGPFRDGGPFARADRAQDFSAIGQALQSGDLGAAQQAFATLADTFGKSFEARA